MLVYLIGMPGSGKSTLGKELANSLGFKWLDLDERIEKIENTKISKIFASKGEEYFRNLESDELSKTFERKNLVVSCGGGTPCYIDNMDLMQAFGLTVYLKADFETIHDRLTKVELAKRPLLKRKEDWNDLLIERSEVYNNADVTVMINQDDLVESIANKVREFGDIG